MDVIKFLLILVMYCAVAPWLGGVLARNRVWERLVFCIMLTMPSWHPSKITLMVYSIETYRGHTKGFEYAHLDVFSIAIILAARRRGGPGFRPWPPGFWLYLFYCAICLLSFIPAYNKLYAAMALWKFAKASLWYAAAFHAFRDQVDLKWGLRALAIAVIFQCFAGVKMRYLEGMWQVKGYFEHQNPMAMWCYLTTVPVLAMAFYPKTSKGDTVLFLSATGAAGFLILLSVSRAGLAAFVIGCAAATGLAWVRGPKAKTIGITAAGGFAALLAGLVALDSVMARVSEVKEKDEVEDLRAVMIKQARGMLQDSPLGIGWNNFGIANSLPSGKYAEILMDWDKSRGFRIIEENYFANPLTESLYWLLLGETGYPGFYAYVLFLAATFYWGVRGTLRFWKSPTGWFLAAVTFMLGVQYLHGTVERVYSQTKNMAIWLLFTGMIARVEICRRRGQDLPERSL